MSQTKAVEIKIEDYRSDAHAFMSTLVNYSNHGIKYVLIKDISIDDKEHDAFISALREIAPAIDVNIITGGNTKRLEDVKKYLYAGAKKVYFSSECENDIKVKPEAVSRFGEDKCIDLEDIYILNADEAVLDTQESVFKCNISFSDLKTDSNGLIPVIAKDYRSGEVLMLAYMNEEAFNTTIRTGMMTYYSRSRQELWTKGLTSGHMQYAKKLVLDCDSDTILASVHQIGPACHTGSRSCFFNEIASLDYKEKNPAKILEDVYGVILDRKANPKEGSYTNYLFDKGIDKMLKKLGEEATEIVIAAKNPDKEEIKYEIADFLYHMLVVMAEREVTLEEIFDELANR